VFNPLSSNQDESRPEQKPKKRFRKHNEELCTDVVSHTLGNYIFTLYDSDRERIQRVNWSYRPGYGYVTNIGTSLEPVFLPLMNYILDVSPDVRVYTRGEGTCLLRGNLRVSTRTQETGTEAGTEA
jgi:hypothetical protein